MSLINLTNHPSSGWSPEQRSTARDAFGPIVDFESGFPRVDPKFGVAEIDEFGQALMHQLEEEYLNSPEDAVFVTGEHRLTFYLVSRLQQLGYRCVTATTERDVRETSLLNGSTKKEATFRFVRWAEYPSLV